MHEWAYGATEVVHIVSLAFGIGLIFLVDLRLLGLGLLRAAPERLVRATGSASLIGLVAAITSGFMVFSTDPVRYFEHPTMRFKLVMLIIALAFNFSVHNRVARGDYSPASRRMVAAVSLLLWVTVVFGGIFYSFS